jgi:hypothetical protein
MSALNSSTSAAWVRAAGLAVAGVVAFGPLESRYGTVKLAGLNTTLPEILSAFALLMAVLAWWRARSDGSEPTVDTGDRLRRWAPVALLLWMTMHVASAAWATAGAGDVLKSGLRVAGSVSLALATWALARHEAFRLRVFAGVLVGLAILTVVGSAERLLGRDMEWLLLLFRDEPTWMLGEQRLTMVFYHANIAAAYLELTAPFLLVAVAAHWQRRWVRVGGSLWLAVVAILLSLTYSRAGLLAAVAGSGGLVWMGWRAASGRKLFWVAGIYALLVVFAYAVNPDMRARIGLSPRSYQASYRFLAPCAGHPGDAFTARVRVRNYGEWPLSNRQAPGVVLHQWLTQDGDPVRKDGWAQEPLPDLEPGGKVELALSTTLPPEPGTYLLAADVERKNVLRISELGNVMAFLTCEVLPPDESPAPYLKRPPRVGIPRNLNAVRSGRPMELDRIDYWTAAGKVFLDRPLWGFGSDRFRLEHERYVPAAAYDGRARAHSVILETAADLGLLGLATLAAVIAALVVAVRRVARTPWPADGARRLAMVVPFAAAAGLSGLAVHSLVDYFLAYTQVAVVVWPLIGLVLATRRPSEDGTCDAPREDAAPPTASDRER